MAAISGDLGANEIIRLLGLKPHPEGGHFVEMYRSEGDGRAACTTIYYLLQADEISAWHRVDADEVWAWHAGGPLSLTLSPPDGKGAAAQMLGPDLRAGQAHIWSFRNLTGRQPKASVHGRWSAASWRRGLSLPGLNSRRTIGDQRSRSTRCRAAVDHKLRARHIAALVRGEKQHAVDDLLNGACPPDGHSLSCHTR